MLTINDIPIEDTFAEAFPMTAARLIVTAETPAWAQTAGQVVTGYASSVIGCDVEASVERTLNEDDTVDGRPGVSILANPPHIDQRETIGFELCQRPTTNDQRRSFL